MRTAKARKDRRFNLHEGCKPTLEISNDIIIILITTIIIALRLSWSETFDLLWLVHILVLEARPPAYPLRPPTPRDVALFPLSDRWQQQHSPPLVSLIAALRMCGISSVHGHPATTRPNIREGSLHSVPKQTRCYFRVHFFFLWNRIFPLYNLAAGSVGYLSLLPRFNRAKGAFCEIGR